MSLVEKIFSNALLSINEKIIVFVVVFVIVFLLAAPVAISEGRRNYGGWEEVYKNLLGTMVGILVVMGVVTTGIHFRKEIWGELNTQHHFHSKK